MITEYEKRRKLVVNLNDYNRRKKRDKIRDFILDDANHSCLVAGRSGSGKDVICMSILDVDMEEKRTVIILDIKMEYPAVVFMQQDQILKDILDRRGIAPASYPVNLWLPYIEGMEKDKHFMNLLKYHHPHLKIRPFRILFKDIESQDTKTFALNLSSLQSFESEGMESELKGMPASLKKFREEAASRQMIFDDYNRWEQTSGWEYLDFNEITTNKQVNVISFYFMFRTNAIIAISTANGIMSELLSLGMKYHAESEIFCIYIPELQLIMPKGVKQLGQIADTLKFKLKSGLLLMRSFHARMRINLQNLSSLDPDMFSQSNLYIGRTTNPQDISLLQKYYKFNRIWVQQLFSLPVGKFIDLQKKGNKKLFMIVPRSNKAKEREHFIIKIKDFNENPSKFLYETENVYLSDLPEFVPSGTGMTIDQYEKKVKDWINSQTPRKIKPLMTRQEAKSLESYKKEVKDIKEKDVLEEFGIT